jgi:hypothetical protein
MLKETRDVVILVARLGTSIGEAMKDGKVELADLVHLGPVVAALPAAFSGLDQIVAEIKGATDADREELNQAFCAEFSWPTAKAELAVEGAFDIIISLWKLLSALKA